MTSTEVTTLVQNIVTDLDSVSSLAAGVDPKLVPYIAIGQAVDKQLPGLVASVTAWIQGNPPADAEVQTLLQQLGVLGDPKAP